MDDDDDEGPTCPLCLEELDATDRAVKACQCGYQVRCAFASRLCASRAPMHGPVLVRAPWGADCAFSDVSSFVLSCHRACRVSPLR